MCLYHFSHRFNSRLLAPILQVSLTWTEQRREYVASPKEVAKYIESKKRALKWVQCFDERPHRRVPLDAIAIEYSLRYHLFDPMTRIPSGATFLSKKDTKKALTVSKSLLTDLEPFLSTKNIVTFTERLGRIVAYSDPSTCILDHKDCIIALANFIQMALQRCSLSELAAIVWSLGKFGSRIMTLELDEGILLHDVVLRILKRMKEHGVRGELDTVAISNLLNGAANLEISLDSKMRHFVLSKLKAHIEFSDTQNLTRAMFGLHHLQIKSDDKLLIMICNSAEAKMKASKYPLKELLHFAWALSMWQKANPILNNFCEALNHHLMINVTDIPSKEGILGLEAFINFQYFPSIAFLEHISVAFAEDMHSLAPSSYATFFRCFAELGIRPTRALTEIKVMMLDEEQEMKLSPSVACLVLQSLSILNSLELNDVKNVWMIVKNAFSQLSDLERAALYQSLLHLRYLQELPEDIHEIPKAAQNELCKIWRSQEEAFIKSMSPFILKFQKELPDDMKVKQVTLADGDLDIFSFIREDGTKFALLFDKTTFQNKNKRLCGSSLWRRRLLQKLGWIPFDVDNGKNTFHQIMKISKI